MKTIILDIQAQQTPRINTKRSPPNYIMFNAKKKEKENLKARGK